MEEKVTREQSTKSDTFAKTNNCKKRGKNVLLAWLVTVLYSTFYTEYTNTDYTNTVWIVFQEKYEVFRHLIKDNK